jgi:hypothetical protein
LASLAQPLRLLNVTALLLRGNLGDARSKEFTHLFKDLLAKSYSV